MYRIPVKQAVLCAVCSFALLGGAIAQQQQQGQSSSTPAPIVGKVPLGVSVAEANLIATGWRASKLVRADVYNEKGEKIGKVDDLVVAPDGTLSIAVVEVGGFLGMGKHMVAIPVKQFTQVAPRAVLPGATKEALKQLPEFQYVT